jgi:hypothetical protein
MTGNRSKFSGSYRRVKIVNPVVAQRKQAVIGTVMIKDC